MRDKIFLVFLQSVFLFSCSQSICANEYEVDERAYDKAIEKAHGIRSLDRWKSLKPQNYYYILSHSESLTIFPLVAVYVIDGKVVNVKNLHPFMNVGAVPDVKDFKTIDELFVLITRIKKGNNNDLTVEYNSRFGYPEFLEFEIHEQRNSLKKYRIIDFYYLKK